MAGLATVCALLAVISTGSPWVTAPRAQRVASVQDVKAAFLYNFTRYVTWPDGIPPPAEPFRLCIVADRDTTEAARRAMEGETVHGRPAQTHVPKTAEEVRTCQLLFVAEDAEHRVRPLIAAALQSPTLVVGEGETFTSRGGAIGFVIENGKVRFDVHSRNAARNGLSISSRLLNVARRTDMDRR